MRVASVPKNERSFYRKLIDPFISFFTNNADAYITYNSFADEYLINSFSISRSKIFRAQNALDTTGITKDIEKFKDNIIDKKKELGLLGYKVALFIGGIEKRKRINNLISAISNLNEQGILAKALIVGDGPDLKWVIDNTNKYEKKHSIFAGKHIDDSVLYLLLSDVVVLPAQGGLSINHAFACGKPFIGTTECYSPGTKIYL